MISMQRKVERVAKRITISGTVRLIWTLLILITVAWPASSMPVSAASDSVLQASSPQLAAPPSVEEGQNLEVFQENAGSMLAPAASTGGPDTFGYTWDDSQTFPYIPATSGGSMAFPGGTDDAWTSVNLTSFSFPFYERSYSKVYISSNGLLGFDTTFTRDSLANARNWLVPLDHDSPQNIIAPLWDDLAVGGKYNPGNVYYKEGVDAKGKYFVAEWHQITSPTKPISVTFEAVLYEDGDIVLQYDNLIGSLDSVTVGIEDQDGAYGLQYLYNGVGQALAPGKDILFNYPDAKGPRAKGFPVYQGGFNLSGAENFYVYIRNTANSSPPVKDVYNLEVQRSDSNWQVELANAAGALLTDTDGDTLGRLDTGLLNQYWSGGPSPVPGSTFTTTVRVLAPDNAPIGATAAFTLTAYSKNSGDTKFAVMRFTSTVPAPFSQMYREGANINLHLFSPEYQFRAALFTFTNPNFAVGNAFGNKVIGVREVISGTNVILDYMFTDGVGRKLFPQPKKLITSSSPGIILQNSNPVVAVAADSKIGVAWVQRADRLSDFRSQYNIFLAILSPDGTSFVQPAKNISNNTEWTYANDDLHVEFSDLRIAAVEGAGGEDRFHITWTESVKFGGVFHNDLAYVVYDTSGVKINPTYDDYTYITNINWADGKEYVEPTLATYNDQVIVFYVQEEDIDPDPTVTQLVYHLVYSLVNSGGPPTFPTLPPMVSLYESNAVEIDAIQLNSGYMALAWTNASSGEINMAVLDNSLNAPAQPTSLANPDKHPGSAVSISRDILDHAILTWMDSNAMQSRLYYALVDSSGLLVPAMPFMYRPKGVTYISITPGVSNAFYTAMSVNFFPLAYEK